MEVWFWQAAFALIVGAFFFRMQLLGWLRGLAAGRPSLLGYLFATTYAMFTLLLIDATFALQPIPRFDDLFLIGIALTAYFFHTRPAVYLLSIGVVASLWVLPPLGSFHLARAMDAFRIASFACISALLIFVMRHLKSRRGRQTPSPLGYLFATTCALVGAMINFIGFHGQPVPRFNDVFLVGIAVTVYFFSVTPATYLLALSIAVSAWILPPGNSFWVQSLADCYRLISYTVVAGLLLFLTARLKTWSSHALQGNQLEGLSIHRRSVLL